MYRIKILFKSLIPEKYIPIESKIIKFKEFDKSIHKCIWQVAEYDSLPKKRIKYIGGRSIVVGISYTLNFFRKKKWIYKVLILSSNNLDTVNTEKKIFKQFDLIIIKSNAGLDLGSHEIGFDLLSAVYKKNPGLPVIISNSSFKPYSSLKIKGLISIAKNSNVLIGSSFAFGPKYFFFKKLHLQSFFLISISKNFVNIFEGLNLVSNNKFKIIRDGELKLSENAILQCIPLLSYDGSIFRLFTGIKKSIFFYDHRKNISKPNSI